MEEVHTARYAGTGTEFFKVLFGARRSPQISMCPPTQKPSRNTPQHPVLIGILWRLHYIDMID